MTDLFPTDPPPEWKCDHTSMSAWADAAPVGKNWAPVRANPEAKATWLAALRSGKFEQCTGSLRKHDAFCCLGVACEASGLGKWIDGEPGATFYAEKPPGDIVGADDVLHVSVADWLGLETNPQVAFHGKVVNLSDLNDHTTLMFSDIADIIEEQL